MIEAKTKDGYILKGNLFSNDQAKAVVILNPGTATKTSFYEPFAKYISDHGYHVFLWNYRGFCESKTTEIKNSSIRFSDIGQKDIPAVIEKMKEMFPHLPLLAVGHSAGGQHIGLASNNQELKGLIALAVSAGYFGNMPSGYKMKALYFFKIFTPVMNLFYGFVPAKKFNIMEDLPYPLAKEWGEWCTKSDYIFDSKFWGVTVPKGNYEKLPFPVKVLTALDDEISTPKNVENFWKHVHSEKGIEFKTYDPKNFPKKRIAHFGYFRKENKQIWDDVVSGCTELLSR